MADVDVDVIVEAISRGFDKVSADMKGLGAESKRAGDSVESAGGAAKRSGSMFAGLQSAILPVGAALVGLGVAAQQAYSMLKEGAELTRAADVFDNLTESIGSTADAMLTKLKAATSGMIADSDLIASASQIISLGLADTEDNVVRLATLVGKLGWDMQQVIMTFANDSKMRLDALGLSVTDIEERMKKFTDAGMAASEAFDLAVIEAGEDKLLLLGDAADSTAGKFLILEASVKNAMDQMKISLIESWSEDDIEGITRGLTNLVELFSALSLIGFRTLNDLQLPQFTGAGPGGIWERLGLWEMGVPPGTSIPDMILGRYAAGGEAMDADRLLARYVPEPQDMAAAIERWTAQVRGSGRGGGLLGDIIGDPGRSLADLQAAQAAIGEIFLQLQRGVDETRRAWRTDVGGIFAGLFDTSEMEDPFATLLDSASGAGASAQALYDLAGGGDAAKEALVNAAIEVRAAELGQAVADGVMTAGEAITALQTFIDGLNFEKLLTLDKLFDMRKWLPDTQQRIIENQQAWREMEGITEPGLGVGDSFDTANNYSEMLGGIVSKLDNIATPRTITVDASSAETELVNKVTPLAETLDSMTNGYTVPVTVDLRYGEGTEAALIQLLDDYFARQGATP